VVTHRMQAAAVGGISRARIGDRIPTSASCLSPLAPFGCHIVVMGRYNNLSDQRVPAYTPTTLAHVVVTLTEHGRRRQTENWTQMAI
jgi:hypothetical protein